MMIFYSINNTVINIFFTFAPASKELMCHFSGNNNLLILYCKLH
jgi:hypothetical protein